MWTAENTNIAIFLEWSFLFYLRFVGRILKRIPLCSTDSHTGFTGHSVMGNVSTIPLQKWCQYAKNAVLLLGDYFEMPSWKKLDHKPCYCHYLWKSLLWGLRLLQSSSTRQQKTFHIPWLLTSQLCQQHHNQPQGFPLLHRNLSTEICSTLMPQTDF